LPRSFFEKYADLS